MKKIFGAVCLLTKLTNIRDIRLGLIFSKCHMPEMAPDHDTSVSLRSTLHPALGGGIDSRPMPGLAEAHGPVHGPVIALHQDQIVWGHHLFQPPEKGLEVLLEVQICLRRHSFPSRLKLLRKREKLSDPSIPGAPLLFRGQSV